MKKLMFAAAAAVALVGMAEIESSNVVGYVNDAAAKPYVTKGMMFVAPGNTTGTWKMNDVVLEGSTYQEDLVQFLDPVAGKMDSSKNLTYWSVAENDGEVEGTGWFYMDEDETSAEDLEFPVGQAFICNFYHTDLKILFAGEVVKGEQKIVCPASKPYATIVNPVPRAININEIKVAGSTYQEDIIQFLDPVSGKIDSSKNLTYWSIAENDGEEEGTGWFYMDEDETSAEDVTLAVGQGFICNFAHDLTLTFPSAL